MDDAVLREANLAFAAAHPGEGPGRQPVHTVYGGAQLFAVESVPKLGRVALAALDRHAAAPGELGRALGIGDHPSLEVIHQRVREKLGREPVEDFRIDFEDGYGNRPDAEEDAHATAVGKALAAGRRAGTLAPFMGIRIKPLSEELRARSLRTLELVHTALLESGGGEASIPENWVVTLPKITVLEQVEYLVGKLAQLERTLGLASGTLRIEVMVETPQLLGLLPRVVGAASGRLRGAHFGTYDYTAGLNITAAQQRMQHPACDYAKHAMQVGFAGTGVWLSDGSTTVLPVGPDRAAVQNAWRLHFADVRHSLAGGFYQGWDLHPAQLVSRYAALYSFFLDGIEAAGARLRNFVGQAARATLVGDVFDDAATGQGLLNFFLRGVHSGAISEAEALEMSGLTGAELRSRSFGSILQGRA